MTNKKWSEFDEDTTPATTDVVSFFRGLVNYRSTIAQLVATVFAHESFAGELLRTGLATFDVRKHNVSASTAPTTGDDSDDDYAVGSLWIDTTGGDVYRCVDASVGAAVWVQLNGGGGSNEFADNLFRIIGSGDSSKKLAIEVDGITTSTTRTATFPDADIDFGDMVSATAAFATDNVVVKSDGTGRGSQATGIGVDDSDNVTEVGSIRMKEISDPTNVTDKGFIYVKNDSGDTELYYMDAGGNVVQLTKDGKIVLPSITYDSTATDPYTLVAADQVENSIVKVLTATNPTLTPHRDAVQRGDVHGAKRRVEQLQLLLLGRDHDARHPRRTQWCDLARRLGGARQEVLDPLGHHGGPGGRMSGIYGAMLGVIASRSGGTSETASGECLFGAGGYSAVDTETWATVTAETFFTEEGFEVTVEVADGQAWDSVDYICEFDSSNRLRFASGDSLQIRIDGTYYTIDTSSVNWPASAVSDIVITVEYGVSMALDVSSQSFSDSVSLVGSSDWSGLSTTLYVGENSGGGGDWNFGDIGCFKRI